PDRALPSFPTRRSSDLSRQIGDPARVEPGREGPHELRGDHPSRRHAKAVQPRIEPLEVGEDKLCPHAADCSSYPSSYQDGAVAQDRKSTRLNSSHVSIS